MPQTLRRSRRFWPILAVALGLSACSGGGGGGSGAAPPAAGASVISQADAVRAAKQASFGPTLDLVNHMVELKSVGAWVDEQVAAAPSSYADLLARAVPSTFCKGKTGADAFACIRDNFSSAPVAMEFYAHAVTGADQLRQRVAFALSQLIVASDVEVHSTAGLAAFDDILLAGAFGNYRDLLKAVTLNAYMGDYLDMADSAKAAPNENYARELMQLFSTGVNQLNMDGTLVRDATGAPVPVYTADDVHNVARALTGWTYARLNGAAATDATQRDYTQPMIMRPAAYDGAAKTFLGTTVAAGAAQADSLQAVVDAVFNTASTAPYVSRFLIQHLVTSNPSPAYIGRVAAVFANNGSGVRGDLKAVVKAILTDAEARGDARSGAADGKVKEPVLLITALARLIPMTATDGYAFITRDAAMGQQPFRAPSVFNFYPPDYPLAGGGGLLSPPSKLLTVGTTVARHNLVYDWTVGGDGRPEFAAQAGIPGAIGSVVDWSSWQAFGTDLDGMLDRIDLLMMNRTMGSAQRAALKTAMQALTGADAPTLARRQAQLALYLVASSPYFQIDR